MKPIGFPASMPSERFVFEGERGISESFRSTLRKVKLLLRRQEANVYIYPVKQVSGKSSCAKAIHENEHPQKKDHSSR